MRATVRDINQRFWNSKSIPHLTIRTTYNSTQSYKAHYHSELSIGLIESGSTCLSMPEEQIILDKGDIVIIEPNMVHACNPVNDIPRSYHMLYVDNDWCCEMLSALYGYEVTQFRCDQYKLDQQDIGTQLSALVSTLSAQGAQNVASELDAHLLNLLSNFCSPQREAENSDELASKLKHRLLRDIAQPSPLDIMSKELGRSKESLIRNFKNHFGITPKSFLNNNRVEKAKLLLKSGMNIVDVATEVGFSDQSQLHRAFVNYTASTPRQYQQMTSIFDNNL
ncbi:AraC family transcriptional regulator [Vibrio sonorensis]|uniref:AraC family transcriptional regulator n=1 Tax=Vibrio sonorensis TaxID=1004316 RepID=UPI0008DAE51F|nr:AraC family transcriptional regulator [Vibrio sonorensis]